MSDEKELSTDLCEYSTDDVRIDKTLDYVGWPVDAFVEACSDFDLSAPDYDWSSVLENMWARSHARIRSQLDVICKFKRCNDWSGIARFALAFNRQRLIIDIDSELPTSKEMEDVIWSQKKFELLPCDGDERTVLWHMVMKILQLQSYLYKRPDKAFDQVIELRIAAEKKKKEAEDKRQARFLRRQAQKKKKHRKN